MAEPHSLETDTAAVAPGAKPLPGLRRVAGSSALLLVENGLRLAATAAGALWVAHALGPEAYGHLGFAMALMVLFLSVASLGLELPLVLRLARDEPPGPVLGTALGLRAAGAGAAFTLAAGAALVLRHGQGDALAATLIVALSVIGYAPSVVDVWFKARVEPRAASIARLVTTFGSLAVKLVVIALGGGLVEIAWTIAFEAALCSLTLCLAWRHAARGRASDALRFDPKLAKALWREGLPYLGSGVVVLLATRIDVLLLGVLSSAAQTGLYSLAQRLAEVLVVVPVVLLDTAFPVLARRAAAAASGTSDSGQLLFDLASASAWLTAGAAVALTPVLGHLLGSGFADAAPLFGLLAWTGVSVALAAARHRWLAASGLQRHAIGLALQAVLVSAVLNAVLIPRWGAVGAAVAALATGAVTGIASSFAIAALRPIGLMQWRSLWPWGRLWQLARTALQARRALA